MNKSYVTLEQKVCPVTGKTFDSGAILIDRRMKDTFDHHTITGWEISSKVQEQLDKGFIALVGINEEKSTKLNNGNISPEGAYRTGEIIYLKKTVFPEIFNKPVTAPFMFISEEVIEYLKKLQEDK